MPLQDVMTPEVAVIAPEASIYEAAEKMSHLDVGPLPVCDGERLVGMLTDRDITVRPVAAEVLKQVSEPGTSRQK
jgi:CBS domain-containing protein